MFTRESQWRERNKNWERKIKINLTYQKIIKWIIVKKVKYENFKIQRDQTPANIPTIITIQITWLTFNFHALPKMSVIKTINPCNDPRLFSKYYVLSFSNVLLKLWSESFDVWCWLHAHEFYNLLSVQFHQCMESHKNMRWCKHLSHFLGPQGPPILGSSFNYIWYFKCEITLHINPLLYMILTYIIYLTYGKHIKLLCHYLNKIFLR